MVKRTRLSTGWMMAGLILLFLISGCGYGFRGGTNNLPSDIKGVYLPVFINATTEPGAEIVFTNALIYEFTRSRMLNVVPQTSAQAMVQGKIKRIAVDPVIYANLTSAVERKVAIDLDVSCRRSDNQKVLWQNQNMSRFEVFAVTSDPSQTERNKQEAINKIAKFLSEQIHNGILENF